MGRRKETEEQLRARILGKMREDIGISEAMARPFVESVMQCFAGERLYFPARQRDYQVDSIRLAIQAGTRLEDVCRKYDVSRRQLYRLFPGGLPRVLGASR